jgi:CRISPR-associated Csx10 family RAMP protein
MAISADRGDGNQTGTRLFAPPSTLRGALAATVKRAGVASEDDMQRLFGTRGCRPSALLPSSTPAREHEQANGADGDASGEDATERTASAPGVQFAPLTLLTCKRHPGFAGETNASGREAHGVSDRLLASAAFAAKDDASALEALQTCPECGNVLRPKGGFVQAGAQQQSYRTQPPPTTRVQTHVGIDRRRKGASPGALYSREVINESGEQNGRAPSEAAGSGDRLMSAAVTGPPEVMRLLSETVTEAGTLRVGNAVSRGLGRCEVVAFEERDAKQPERRADLTERVEETSAAAAQKGLPEGTYVTLTLRTPALFVDAFLRPELRPGSEDLLQAAWSDHEAYAEALAALDPVHQVARPYQFSAWNGLAGFPHATDQGLAAGSALLFRAPEGLTDALAEALLHAETAGVGLRRHLGCGRVRVGNAMHFSLNEVTRT